MKRNGLVTLIRVIAAITAAVSLYMILSNLITGKQEQSAFDDLASAVAQVRAQQTPSAPTVKADAPENAPEEEASSIPEGEEPPIPEPAEESGPLPEYEALYAMNPDFFGWLQMDDTPIDYPVMFTPEDPQYYLHRAFDGTGARSGTPFLDGACFEGCGNYIIYGHHMKNGSMFAALEKYGKRSFWESHPTFRFDTLYERGTYEVVAAFYGEAIAPGDPGFRYYQYTDLTDPAAFQEYVQQVKSHAAYDTGITPDYGEELITLSTCSYHTDDGRFVVVGRKMN